MNYDCNVRRQNAKLQVRKSGILVSHRIELPHRVCFTVLGMSGAKQSLATRLVAHHAYRHLPLGLRFRSASDQSGRQALAVYVAQYPSSAGRDALATCIRGQEASAATRRGGNRHKQDVEEDYRSP